MWDTSICYDCHEQPGRFSVEKRDGSEYPDLEPDAEGWVRVPLCRDCVTRWEGDE